jgi:hypothetical protein
MGAWGYRYLPVSEELGVRAQVLRDGGAKMRADFMDELRARHLGATPRKTRGPSVSERLQAAYDSAMARKTKDPRTKKRA